MPPKSKNTKGGGYGSAEAPPPAPAKPEDDSESEDESSSEDGSGSDAGPPPEAKGPPRFKTLAEQRAHEEEVKKAALADEATIKRLEEVRLRREKARLEREAAEKTAAEEEARRKAEAEAAAAAREKALSERPTLEVPGPKDVKAALTRLQECASDDFLQKHGIKGATGNKLAKIKNADFQKIFKDFQDNAPVAELHKFKGT
eukprot:TRINITY_DN68041_c0_g1_i1.p1 TRINITY_DN68041_c0_g1~~TRINITY_DN68041_c0_g1_i1.p1  ORF type:complete len:202 (-),score=69.52 TRINITY_DN68041_c0_g1_i1:29-634(-)